MIFSGKLAQQINCRVSGTYIVDSREAAKAQRNSVFPLALRVFAPSRDKIQFNGRCRGASREMMI
ncbi:hypothetical protein [Parasphingorhabdus sp.]|uniref:hypothetical protein n=1 Tax=Parasphingorhabdus sp. TaxID=2709688 RepID=UPI003A8FEE29